MAPSLGPQPDTPRLQVCILWLAFWCIGTETLSLPTKSSQMWATLRENLNTTAFSKGTVSIHTSAKSTLEEESPDHMKVSGSRADAVNGGQPSYCTSSWYCFTSSCDPFTLKTGHFLAGDQHTKAPSFPCHQLTLQVMERNGGGFNKVSMGTVLGHSVLQKLLTPTRWVTGARYTLNRSKRV